MTSDLGRGKKLTVLIVWSFHNSNLGKFVHVNEDQQSQNYFDGQVRYISKEPKNKKENEEPSKVHKWLNSH